MRASLSLRRSFSIFLRNRVSNANSSVGCPIVVSPRAAGLLWPPPVVWGKTRGAAVYRPQGRRRTMEDKRDKARVDPLSGGEEEQPARPLQTVPPGQPANATTAVIPGTGEVVKDVTGKEVKRVVQT